MAGNTLPRNIELGVKRYMNETEITKILRLSFPELVKLCRNPEGLAKVISLCINMGIKLGRDETHRYYKQMFRGYDKVSIEN